MSYLDALLRKVVTINSGTPLVERKTWNFVSGATAVDNPATGATDITFGANGITEETIEWNPPTSAGTESVTSKAIYATTTNATTTTLASFTQPAESTVDYTATVTGRSSNGKHFRLDLRAAYEVIDGTFVAIDAPSTSGALSVGNAAAWTAVFDRSGSDIRVRVTGEAATTVRWCVVADAQISYIDSTPAPTFDPLSVGTPILWLDATQTTNTGDGTDVTAIVERAAVSTVTITAGEEPFYDAVDANYAGAATFDITNVTTPQEVKITNHGLTTGAFTVVFVGDGQDAFWFSSAGGNSFGSAGGGSGDKLQMTSDAATLLVSTSVAKAVPGVYVLVFNGASSKIYTSALTADVTGNTGALEDLTGDQIVVGNYGTPSIGNGLNGSVRHFLIYSGALSNADCGYLLTGFGAESGITIGA